MTLEALNARIAEYLTRSGLAKSEFGRRAASDPRLVFDLENGREPRRALRQRVAKWMDENPVAEGEAA